MGLKPERILTFIKNLKDKKETGVLHINETDIKNTNKNNLQTERAVGTPSITSYVNLNTHKEMA